MQPPQRQGFTLIECILSLLMIGILSAGFCSLLYAAFTTSELPSVTLNGVTYAKAPDNRTDERCHRHAGVVFNQLQQNADAIFVFGGKGSHPTLDPTGPSSVIDWASWPTSLGNGPTGDPAQQFSSWAQRSAAAGALSSLLTTAGSPADFFCHLCARI